MNKERYIYISCNYTSRIEILTQITQFCFVYKKVINHIRYLKPDKSVPSSRYLFIREDNLSWHIFNFALTHLNISRTVVCSCPCKWFDKTAPHNLINTVAVIMTDGLIHYYYHQCCSRSWLPHWIREPFFVEKLYHFSWLYFFIIFFFA